MWMTPLEVETSRRVMQASPKADEFPLPLPEEEQVLGSEVEAESVDEHDSEDR
jgi:hypothetical protein